MPERMVTARAGTNIALVKYWGKRDAALNLPATGSLSLTLSGLGTETRVRFAGDVAEPGGQDRVLVAGTPPEPDGRDRVLVPGTPPEPDGRDRVLVPATPADPAFAGRVRRFLDLVRERAGLHLPAEVVTTNSVPTASGLASSASGFAALALAATRAAGLVLAPDELSALARRGSGSAARSIFGGFAEMAPGTRADGADAHARPLLAPDAWDVRLVVALTTGGRKAVGSTEAMERTAKSSPYYPAWLAATALDLAEARSAVAARDIRALGRVAERSALRMHACALAAEPPVIYWNGVTLAAVEEVLAMRASGTIAYFTIDAGPHVKVLCASGDAAAVESAMRAVAGVTRTLVAAPGPGAHVIEERR
jgi:diphosphomevalonate decarboxylase